jgi:hypothetical protein
MACANEWLPRNSEGRTDDFADRFGPFVGDQGPVERVWRLLTYSARYRPNTRQAMTNKAAA